MTEGGELIIRNVNKLDVGQYKCRARSRLTGRSVTSSIGGQLILNEQPHVEALAQAPGTTGLQQQQRIRALDPIDGQARLLLVREQADLLMCAKFQFLDTEAAPNFQWSRSAGAPKVGEHQTIGVTGEAHMRAFESCLIIGQAQAWHAGDYACEASDPRGNRARALFRLVVALESSRPAQIIVQSSGKQLQQHQLVRAGGAEMPLGSSGPQSGGQPMATVQLGSTVQLNCSLDRQLVAVAPQGMARGRPGEDLAHLSAYNAIDWLKDGKLIGAWRAREPEEEGKTFVARNARANHARNKIKLSRPNLLSIEHFELNDRGVYQCQAYWSTSGTGAGERRPAPTILTLFNGSTVDEILKQQQQQRGDDAYRLMAGHQFEAKLERIRMASTQNAVVQLELAYQKPQLVDKFPNSQVVSEESPVAGSTLLECSATGVPLPHFSWFLDNFRIVDSDSMVENLSEEGRFSVQENGDDELAGLWTRVQGEPVIQDNDKFHIKSWQTRVPNWLVVSQLNISAIRGTESGQYKCVASNALGQASHQGRVNVIQLQPDSSVPQLRAYQPTNLSLIAGQPSVLLQCPMVGFPLRQIDWFLNGHPLPRNHRQRIEPIRQQVGGQLELLNVDMAKSDEGIYTCAVQMDQLHFQASSNASTGASPEGQRLKYETASQNFEQQVGEIQVSVRVAPMIDTQLLPQVVEANEGMRTKLVCSVVQGDHPIEIRWFKKASDASKAVKLEFSANSRDAHKATRVHLLRGFEPVQVAQQHASNQDELLPGDSITVNDLEDSSLVTFRQISHLDDGEYLCLAQNEFSMTHRRVRVIVHQAPSWSIEPPGEVYALLKQRLQIDCLAHGNPAPAGNWLRASNGQHPVAATALTSAAETKLDQQRFNELVSSHHQRVLANGSLVFEQLEAADSGVYMCEQSNTIGSGLSKLIRLHVQVAPQFGKQNQLIYYAKINAQTELKCLVWGDQPILIGWRKQNQVIDLVNDQRHRTVSERKVNEQTFESSLAISKLVRADSGLYSCIASNEFGTEELNLLLVVQEPPEAPSQIMRPIKSEARQATLAFTRPFSGNSPIRKYAVLLKQLAMGANEPLQTQVADSFMNSANFTSGSIDDWQQVLIDAPQVSGDQQQEPLNQSAQRQQQLVELKLCCLKPFTKYLVRMRALNDIGQSDLSKAFTLVTDEETIGGPPLDVSVEPTGAHSLKVRWRPPAHHLQNGLIRGYYIGYRALRAGSVGAANLRANLEASEGPNANGGDGLMLDQQFQYKNVQLDPNGSQWRQMLTGANSFDAARAQMQLGMGEQQALTNSTIGSGSSLVAQQSPQVYTSYLTNLRRKTTYTIIVQAYNKVGAGPHSDQILVSTLDAAPPMSPLLKLLSVTYNSAQLTWSSRKFGAASGQLQNHLHQEQRAEHVYHLNSDDESEFLMLDPNSDDDPQSFYTLSYRLETVSEREHTSLQSMDSVQSNVPSSTTGGEWQHKRLTRVKGKQPLVALQNLHCGSSYLAYMTATNSLGQSEPGETIRFNTMGGAPVAPAQSRDFLRVNSSFVALHLDQWNNAGCLIGYFVIRYKQHGNNKWTVIEHHVYPTIQTITKSGSAVYSTARSSSGPAETEAGHQNRDKDSRSQQQFSEMILRNLQVSSEYKMIVEAISDAGATSAEYEFETENCTSRTVAVNVNGLIAAEQQQQLGTGDWSARRRTDLLPQSGLQDFNLGPRSIFTAANSQPHLQLQRYPFGIWSVTLVFVCASVLMGLVTLLLAFKSVWRSHSSSRSRRSKRDSFHTNGPSPPPMVSCGALNQSVLSSLLQCNAPPSNSSSSSSTGGCSSSSTSNGNGNGNGNSNATPGGPNTCRQQHKTPNESGRLSSIEATYCSLPAHNGGLMLADSPSNQSPSDLCQRYVNSAVGAITNPTKQPNSGQCMTLRHPSQLLYQMAPSSSLSTIANNARAAHTLSRHSALGSGLLPFATANASLDIRQRQHQLDTRPDEAQSNGSNLLRAHYAATLGRQHQVQSTNFSSMSSQPHKFAHNSPLYGRLDNQHAEAPSDSMALRPRSPDDCGAGSLPANDHAMSALSSGYDTNTTGTSLSGLPIHYKFDNNAHAQQTIYLTQTQQQLDLSLGANLYQPDSRSASDQRPQQQVLNSGSPFEGMQQSSFTSCDPFGVIFGDHSGIASGEHHDDPSATGNQPRQG